MEKYRKTAVFLGGYGRIREILHGRLWPDRGIYRVETLYNIEEDVLQMTSKSLY